MRMCEILDEWYPTWGKGGWGDHTNCMCDKCKDYRISKALAEIKNELMRVIPEIDEFPELQFISGQEYYRRKVIQAITKLCEEGK